MRKKLFFLSNYLKNFYCKISNKINNNNTKFLRLFIVSAANQSTILTRNFFVSVFSYGNLQRRACQQIIK